MKTVDDVLAYLIANSREADFLDAANLWTAIRAFVSDIASDAELEHTHDQANI